LLPRRPLCWIAPNESIRNPRPNSWGIIIFIYEISVKFLGYFPTSAATLCSSAAFSNVITNRVCSHPACKFNCQLCAATIPCEMLNRSPVPSPSFFAVKNGWPTLFLNCFWDTLAAVHHGNLHIRS
jgi:hypothetical protein